MKKYIIAITLVLLLSVGSVSAETSSDIAALQAQVKSLQVKVSAVCGTTVPSTMPNNIAGLQALIAQLLAQIDSCSNPTQITSITPNPVEPNGVIDIYGKGFSTWNRFNWVNRITIGGKVYDNVPMGMGSTFNSSTHIGLVYMNKFGSLPTGNYPVTVRNTETGALSNTAYLSVIAPAKPKITILSKKISTDNNKDDSMGAEPPYLVLTYRYEVDAPDGPTYFWLPNVRLLQSSANDTGGTYVNSMKTKTEFTNSITSAGNDIYRVSYGKTGYATTTIKYPISQLFPGSYKGYVSDGYYFHDWPNTSNVNPYQVNVAPYLVSSYTGDLGVVGETTPWIDTLSPSVVAGSYLTVTGLKLNTTTAVYVKNSLYPQTITSSADGKSAKVYFDSREAPGIYSLILKKGDAYSNSRQFEIKAAAVVTPVTVNTSNSAPTYINSPISFSANASGGIAPYNYTWDFSKTTEGGSMTGANVSKTFTTVGSKIITLLVSNKDGTGKVTKTWTVNVTTPPISCSSSYLGGDINKSGAIDATDSSLLSQLQAKTATIAQYPCADVDNNKTFDNQDIGALSSCITKKSCGKWPLTVPAINAFTVKYNSPDTVYILGRSPATPQAVVTWANTGSSCKLNGARFANAPIDANSSVGVSPSAPKTLELVCYSDPNQAGLVSTTKTVLVDVSSDVNGDKMVNSTDKDYVHNCVLSNCSVDNSKRFPNADVNRDGQINASDEQLLINIIQQPQAEAEKTSQTASVFESVRNWIRGLFGLEVVETI